MSGLTNFLTIMGTGGEVSDRKNALTEVIGKQIVDTCMCHDTGKWETGIKRNDKWFIVEKYENGLEAKKGHKKWVKKLRQHPRMKLEDDSFEEWL